MFTLAAEFVCFILFYYFNFLKIEKSNLILLHGDGFWCFFQKKKKKNWFCPKFLLCWICASVLSAGNQLEWVAYKDLFDVLKKDSLGVVERNICLPKCPWSFRPMSFVRLKRSTLSSFMFQSYRSITLLEALRKQRLCERRQRAISIFDSLSAVTSDKLFHFANKIEEITRGTVTKNQIAFCCDEYTHGRVILWVIWQFDTIAPISVSRELQSAW